MNDTAKLGVWKRLTLKDSKDDQLALYQTNVSSKETRRRAARITYVNRKALRKREQIIHEKYLGSFSPLTDTMARHTVRLFVKRLRCSNLSLLGRRK